MQQTLLASANHFGDRLQELQIQALARPTLYGDRVVNRWVRVKPLRSNDERRTDMAMGVEVDINTLPEDSYDLSANDIEEFIKHARAHIEEQVPILQEPAFFEG